MFNVIRKSNNSVVNSFNTEDQAKAFLSAIGSQRNFMKIVDVSEPSVAESEVIQDKGASSSEDMLATLSLQLLQVNEALTQHPEYASNDDVSAKLKALLKYASHKSGVSVTRKAGKSDLSQKILDVLSGVSNNQSSCSDIAKTLVTDGVYESQSVALKKVSDRCWLMEKQGLLEKVSKGVYKIKE